MPDAPIEWIFYSLFVALAFTLFAGWITLQTRERQGRRADEKYESVMKHLSDSPVKGVMTVKPPDPAAGIGEPHEVEVAFADDQIEKLAEVAKPPDPADRSWLEKWGVTLIVGVLAFSGTVAVGLMNFIDEEPPSCPTYVESLLKVRESAGNVDSAVAAVTAIDWGIYSEVCGLPEDFVRPLG